MTLDTASLPSNYPLPIPTAANEIALGLRIGARGEVDNIGLGAAQGFGFGGSDFDLPLMRPIQTTLATDTTLGDWTWAKGDAREDLLLETNGEDVTITVELYTTGAVLIDSATTTHTTGGRSDDISTGLSGITQDTVVVRVKVKRASGAGTPSGKLYGVRLREAPLGAADLPL